MKINTNRYGLVYKNHNGAFTRNPYMGLTWPTAQEAKQKASMFKDTKKSLKVVRMVMETV